MNSGIKKTNRKPKASRDIMIYTIGTAIRQLVGFVMLPIYTTYLKPADYGIVAMLTLAVAVFELVLGARFVQAVPRFYYDVSDEKSKRAILSTALSVTALVSLVGVGLIWLINEPVSWALFGTVDHSIYISFFAVLLFTTGVERYGMTYLRLLERPMAFMTASILKFAVQLSLSIYLVVMNDYGVMGVILSSVISSLLFCAIFSTLIYWNCGFTIQFPIVKKLFLYTWPLWVAGSAAIFIHSSNRFFIRSYGSIEEVGLFELAARFSAILGILIWEPFTHWWSVERFKIFKSSINRMGEFQQVFDLVVTVMVFAVAGISMLSGPTIMIMSAVEFHDATPAIVPLTFSVFFFKMSRFFNFSLLASDKTIVVSYLKYISLIVVVALFIAIIPRYGFVGAAYAVLLANIILFLLTYFWGKKHLDLNVKFWYFSKIVTAVVIVILLDIKYLNDGPLISIVLYKALLLLALLGYSVFQLVNNPATSAVILTMIAKVKPKFLGGQKK